MWSPASSAILVQWRTQLMACPSLLAITEPQYHYPTFDFQKDPLPAVLLGETNHRRVRYAEGANGLIGFTLLAKFHFKVEGTQTAADMETLARTVTKELWDQFYGLAWKDIDTNLSSDPTPAMRADGEQTGVVYRSFLLTANVGLDRS